MSILTEAIQDIQLKEYQLKRVQGREFEGGMLAFCLFFLIRKPYIKDTVCKALSTISSGNATTPIDTKTKRRSDLEQEELNPLALKIL